MNQVERNLMGQVFGRLTVIDLATRDSITHNRRWVCKCECGTIKPVWESALLRKHKKSCGCLHRLPQGEFAKNAVVDSYRRMAKKRGHSWGLSREQALYFMTQDCWFCGGTPQNCSRTATGNFFYNGIDRLDNTLGYVYPNCVACCKVCNYMKRTMSVEDFIIHIERIALRRGIK
jgi:hypothetical protein